MTSCCGNMQAAEASNERLISLFDALPPTDRDCRVSASCSPGALFPLELPGARVSQLVDPALRLHLSSVDHAGLRLDCEQRLAGGRNQRDLADPGGGDRPGRFRRRVSPQPALIYFTAMVGALLRCPAAI